jgi:hypothetical protein
MNRRRSNVDIKNSENSDIILKQNKLQNNGGKVKQIIFAVRLLLKIYIPSGALVTIFAGYQTKNYNDLFTTSESISH